MPITWVSKERLRRVAGDVTDNELKKLVLKKYVRTLRMGPHKQSSSRYALEDLVEYFNALALEKEPLVKGGFDENS